MEGKYLRFPELYDKGEPIIICPLDDLLISGPINGLENPTKKITSILNATPTAILAFTGTVKRYYKQMINTKIIINLSASTTRSIYTKKVLLGSITSALRLNASAVAFHINICSKYAENMLRDAAYIVDNANTYGLPVMGIIYPRGEYSDGSVNDYEDLKEKDPEAFSEMVAHCVQIGVDLGVDIIKTHYSGTTESYEKVVNVSQGIPVVISGGPLIDEEKALSNAIDAYKVGASGISFARNVFGRQYPHLFIEKVKQSIKKNYECPMQQQ